MKKHPSSKEWADEFKEFTESEDIRPSAHVSEQILARIRGDLNPTVWMVFAKLSLIHLAVGTITLLFCPQFGINLGGGMGMMGLFMRYGERPCMVGCGAVFMAGSALMASLLLGPEEVRKIRKTELFLFPTLALFSIGSLICFGGGMILELAVFWFIGSVLGGLASLELGWIFRSEILNRVKHH